MIAGIRHPDGSVGSHRDAARAVQLGDRGLPCPVLTEAFDASVPGIRDVKILSDRGDAAELVEAMLSVSAASPSAKASSRGVEDPQTGGSKIREPDAPGVIHGAVPRFPHARPGGTTGSGFFRIVGFLPARHSRRGGGNRLRDRRRRKHCLAHGQDVLRARPTTLGYTFASGFS